MRVLLMLLIMILHWWLAEHLEIHVDDLLALFVFVHRMGLVGRWGRREEGSGKIRREGHSVELQFQLLI